jgi:dephospho-CoA kinase
MNQPSNSSPRIPVVGVVGGIGSGKSAVARWVADRCQATVIDADQLGHEALREVTVRDELVKRFGPEILGEDGIIIRSALAKQVFGAGSDQTAARKDLEQIVHPEIARRMRAGLASAASAGSQLVLLDAAILLEAGWRNLCDLVVFVETPDAIRVQRVMENRGWTESDLRRREASQWSLIDKRREADLIVTNDQTLEYAGKQLLEALEQRGWIHRNPAQ